MPKRHLVPSLERLSMLNIVYNIHGWTKNYEDNYMGKGIYRFIIGPFDIIGYNMTEELTRLLIDKKRITRAALHLLLNAGNFHHLDLSRCPKLVTDDVVHLIATKCKKLKTLNLSDCRRISRSSLCLLTKCLHHAVALDFNKTCVDSQVLQHLLANTPELLELSLQRCSIDDRGLRELCLNASQGDSKLLKLDVSQTYVTTQGIAYILQQMPQLQVVRYPGIFDCLFEAYLPVNFRDGVERDELELSIAKVMSSVDDPGRIYQMRSVVCEDFVYVPNAMLTLLPLLCPHITHVDLRFTTGFDDSGLRQLSNLAELKHVELSSQHDDNSNITFDGGILPLLSEIGKTIQKLSLQDIDNTDLLSICTLCPNLQGLYLFMMQEQVQFTSSMPYNANICKCLQDLNIWSKHGDLTLTPSTLTQVLSCSTKLRELNLIRVDTLTDYVLLEVMQRNGFEQLHKLSLHECNAVSGELMTQLLLNDSNSLQKVKLMNCRDISRRDFQIWEDKVKRENFNVDIDWK